MLVGAAYFKSMRIVEAKPREHFRVSLLFDDGTSGIVDLSHFAGRGVFKIWETPGVFQQLSISSAGALQWPGEVDLCPDSLYLLATGKTAADVFPALNKSVTHA